MSIASGQILLNSDNVETGTLVTNAFFYELCRVSDTVAKPRVVHVSCATPATDSTPSSSADAHFFASFPVGLTAGDEFPIGGFFQNGRGGIVLQYGAGAASRKVIMDLRSGSYGLPACTECKVSVFAYAGAVGAFTPEVIVSSSIVDGHFFPPTRPVYTVGAILDKAPTSGFAMNVPNAARWVDFWAATPGAAFGNAGSSVLQLSVTSPEFPSLLAVKDYVNGTVFPHGGPYELMNQQQNEPVIKLEDNTANASYCFLRFFLEL